MGESDVVSFEGSPTDTKLDFSAILGMDRDEWNAAFSNNANHLVHRYGHIQAFASILSVSGLIPCHVYVVAHALLRRAFPMSDIIWHFSPQLGQIDERDVVAGATELPNLKRTPARCCHLTSQQLRRRSNRYWSREGIAYGLDLESID